MHSASKVVMGASQLSDSISRLYPGDPTTLKAGLAVSLASTGYASLTASAGRALGVSRGRPLDGTTSHVMVEQAGSKVAMQVTAELTQGDLTYYAKNNNTDTIRVRLVTGGTAGAEVVTVSGNDISVSSNAASTGTQIKTALEASAAAMLLIGVVVTGTAGSAQAFFAYTALGTAYVVPGAAVKRHATNGKACNTGAATGAVYASAVKTGIDEDGAELLCALVDLQAGID